MVTELVEKTNDMVDATDFIKVTNNDEWKLHEETIAGKKASYIKMMRNKKMYVYLNQYIDGDFFLKLGMKSFKKSVSRVRRRCIPKCLTLFQNSEETR